jgi:branched-chain amino acid aminotransferase/4-amino-4-deoxychorismate lyase
VIPADDRGFTLGDGLFETVLAEDGRLVAWDAHIVRLGRGAAALGLPAPDQAAARLEAEAALAGLGAQRAAVRLSWSAGSGGRGLDRAASSRPRLTVTAAPAPAPVGPARLVWATVRRNEHSPASRHKTLAYLDNVLARREAAAAGGDEALMLNTAGQVACAAAANVFWVREGALYTPSLACGVLDGIVRAEVLEVARAAGTPVHEVSAPPEAVADADEVFLTNSLIRIRPAFLGDPRDQPFTRWVFQRLRTRHS